MTETETFDLPPGKIAALVTYLDRAIVPSRRRPETSPPTPVTAASVPDGFAIAPIGANLPRYRALFRSVGEEWLWFSRLRLDDASLAAILSDPDVEASALHRDGRDLGLLELDFREKDGCEIAFLGLAPDAIGLGLGRLLIDTALARAERKGRARVWLHTCSLDHPGALAFYVRMGFRPYKRAIEICDDPRLDGLIPLSAAGWLPPIAL